MAATKAVPDMRLELVPVPVADVDRAKQSYLQAGFGDLHDTQVTETMRVVQLTQPVRAAPSFSARAWSYYGHGPRVRSKGGILWWTTWRPPPPLTGRGIELSDVDDMAGVIYSFFNDPDGNIWALQHWSAGLHV
ncbi:MAG TPA: hypothetical protein VMF65_19620 [Acidimicrobiales bacterium]|nr:hypothetical protein [Acidimicrobiales bacterium]